MPDADAVPSYEEIEELAWREFAELPDEIRERVTNLGFVVEDEPPEGKRWLATYQGIPYTKRSVFYPFEYPHKVTIYRGPLLRVLGGDLTRLEPEMRRIVRHELAHYFGISDQRLIEIDRY